MKKCVVWLLVFLSGVWGATLMAADLNISQYADSVAVYKAADSAAAKTDFLVGLVNANKASSHGAFYEILRTADKEDIPYFKEALEKAKSPAVILDIGNYMKALKEPFIAEAKSNPQISRLELVQLQERANKFVAPFQRNIEKLLPAIAVASKKDPQALVAALGKAFTAEEADEVDMAGPVLGLASMEEEGAVMVLKSFDKDGEAKGVLSMMAKVLGPHMVIPALKQMENPASTTKEKDTASLVLFMLPDVEPVYDKVVEAYRHGRYFESPKLKKDKDGKATVTLEDMLGMAVSWWGNIIKGKYEKVEGFVPYVAEKHLAKADGQDKIIEFLSDINFGEAAPYFLEMDVANLSEESLDALLHACYVSPTSKLIPDIGGITGKKEYKAEKFRVFELIFKAVDKKVRAEKKMIFSLHSYPARNQVSFVKDNLSILTEDEKTTIVFLSGSKGDALTDPLPEKDRMAILATLRQGASQKLLQTIDHVEKN